MTTVGESTPLTITYLPNEILATIFEQLPSTTLCNISCVARRFNAVAEWIIYSSISISEMTSDSYPSPIRTAQCCESLLRRPHLWDSLKRFHIRWLADHSAFSSHTSTAPFDYVCQYIRNVLSRTLALESLDLSLGPANLRAATFYRAGSMHAVERSLLGCSLPQLRYCSLGADGRHPYTSILSGFLTTSPLIQHLRLTDLSTPLSLPLSALPSLYNFRGSAVTSASLLPGRPVSSLSLVGQDSEITRDNLPEMTRTTVTLHTLDLSGMSVRLMLLNHISKYLPHLHVLRIKLSLSHTLHYATSGLGLLVGLTAVLSAFSLLRHLDLSTTYLARPGGGSISDEADLCKQWGRPCPLLSYIIFPSRREWTRGEDGGKWVSTEG